MKNIAQGWLQYYLLSCAEKYDLDGSFRYVFSNGTIYYRIFLAYISQHSLYAVFVLSYILNALEKNEKTMKILKHYLINETVLTSLSLKEDYTLQDIVKASNTVLEEEYHKMIKIARDRIDKLNTIKYKMCIELILDTTQKVEHTDSTIFSMMSS